MFNHEFSRILRIIHAECVLTPTDGTDNTDYRGPRMMFAMRRALMFNHESALILLMCHAEGVLI